MTELILAAFTMGILGSFHCVGMCGPLAMSLPLRTDSHWSKFSGALIYNPGRIVTYAVFGLLFGAIGKTFSLFGYQQWLSIVLGVFIIVFIILPKRISALQNRNAGLWLKKYVQRSAGFSCRVPVHLYFPSGC